MERSSVDRHSPRTKPGWVDKEHGRDYKQGKNKGRDRRFVLEHESSLQGRAGRIYIYYIQLGGK